MRGLLRIVLVAVLSFASPARAQSGDVEQEIDQALSALQPSSQVAGRAYPPQSLAELMR